MQRPVAGLHGQYESKKAVPWVCLSATGGQAALFWQNGEIVSSKTGAQTIYAIRDITWETTESYDIGVDMMFFNERLKLTADYYKKRTKNILLKLDIPSYLGYANPNQNAGEISTKGWELEASWREQIGDFF